jgi:phage tail tape-measure protein
LYLDERESFWYYWHIRKTPFSSHQEDTMKQTLTTLLGVVLVASLIGCSGGSLTTREKGAGIGALGGAAAGGIIGATVGHPGAGAAIGGALGLGAGALVGDQLQGQEIKQADQQNQINTNQAELERQRRELEALKKQQREY